MVPSTVSYTYKVDEQLETAFRLPLHSTVTTQYEDVAERSKLLLQQQSVHMTRYSAGHLNVSTRGRDDTQHLNMNVVTQ